MADTVITLGLGEQPGSDSLVSAALGQPLDVQHLSVASYGTVVATWLFGRSRSRQPHRLAGLGGSGVRPESGKPGLDSHFRLGVFSWSNTTNDFKKKKKGIPMARRLAL